METILNKTMYDINDEKKEITLLVSLLHKCNFILPTWESVSSHSQSYFNTVNNAKLNQTKTTKYLTSSQEKKQQENQRAMFVGNGSAKFKQLWFNTWIAFNIVALAFPL